MGELFSREHEPFMTPETQPVKKNKKPIPEVKPTELKEGKFRFTEAERKKLLRQGWTEEQIELEEKIINEKLQAAREEEKRTYEIPEISEEEAEKILRETDTQRVPIKPEQQPPQQEKKAA